MKKICRDCIFRSIECVFIKEGTEDKCETVKHYDEGYTDGYTDAVNNAVEFLETYATFEYPRKGTKECVINICKFKELMKENNV